MSGLGTFRDGNRPGVAAADRKMSSSMRAGASAADFLRSDRGSNVGAPGVCALPTLAFAQENRLLLLELWSGCSELRDPRQLSGQRHHPVLMPQNNTPADSADWDESMQKPIFSDLADAVVCDHRQTLHRVRTDRHAGRFQRRSALPRPPPDDADGSGVARYPQGAGTRYSWGGGFQVGALLHHRHRLALRFSVKSPQWFEPARINSADELGYPRSGNHPTSTTR